MRRVTICLINQKGGCGKSSTCFHLAGQFARLGQRVLLVDADPQGSLSQGFFGSQLVECLEPQETCAALFRDDAFFDPAGLAVQTPIAGIGLVRANAQLAAHNAPNPEMTGLKQFALRSWLEGAGGFDVTLIDCPPNLYQCSWNALLAADYVLIPVPPEDFGAQGLRPVHQAIARAQLRNPQLSRLGHLVSRYDSRLLIHRTYADRLRRLYGDEVLRTVIPEASALKISLACRRPVSHFRPKSPAAQRIAELAGEILLRIELPQCLGRIA